MSQLRLFPSAGTVAPDLLFKVVNMSDQPASLPTPPPTPMVLRPMVPVTRLVSRPSVQIINGRLVVVKAVADQAS